MPTSGYKFSTGQKKTMNSANGPKSAVMTISPERGHYPDFGAKGNAPSCAHPSIDNDTFGCALTFCSFSPPEIRVFGRRAGTARKERSHTRLAGIKMSRNPLQTCPFDGTRDTPGAETRLAGKPAGGFRRQNDTGNVSGKKFQRERKTPPKPPRKSFRTGIFSSEPRNKNSEPRKKNSGARNFTFRPRNFSSEHPKK